MLVGQVESSVTLRATVRVRIKARFAGNGRSLGKKRNTESRSHSGSRGRATSIVGCVAVLGKGLPFPADCALPTMLVARLTLQNFPLGPLVARLSVTELSTWPTSER